MCTRFVPEGLACPSRYGLDINLGLLLVLGIVSHCNFAMYATNMTVNEMTLTENLFPKLTYNCLDANGAKQSEPILEMMENYLQVNSVGLFWWLGLGR